MILSTCLFVILVFQLLAKSTCTLVMTPDLDDQVWKRYELAQISTSTSTRAGDQHQDSSSNPTIVERKESGPIGGSTRGGFSAGGFTGSASGSGIFKTFAGINTAFLVGSSLPPMNVPAALGVNVPFPHVRLLGVGVLRYECQQNKLVNVASKAIMSDMSSGSRWAKYYYKNSTHLFDFTVAQGNDQAYVVGKQSAFVASPVDPNVNVDWLKIDLDGEHFVNRVYVLNTKGGQPKTKECSGASESVDVPYSAEYTFALEF